MKKAKIGKKLTTLVLVLATMMAFATTVFADEVNSHVRVIDGNYNGVAFNYWVYSTLYVDSSRSYRGSIWVTIPSQLVVPAAWMRVKAEIIDKNTGEVAKETAWTDNPTPSYYMYMVTPSYYTSNPVCSRGQYRVYDGTEFRTGFAYETDPVQGTRAISESLLSTLDANGDYPKTETGETYGSVLLADVLGYEPDLIAVRGINEISGYVRNEDLNPPIDTETDYENYRITLEANDWKIPLYDLQGNVIGAFVISEGETVPEGSEFTYEEARAYFAREDSTTVSLS